MIEVWKAIPGYEGLYDVSSLGRIRSVPRKHMRRNCMMTLQNDPRTGRLIVQLRKNNLASCFYVSRLVCAAFHNKPDGKDCVDHINGNPLDNRACNLRWCTQKENCNYPLAAKHRRQAREQSSYAFDMQEAHKARMCAVRCVETAKTYESQQQAADAFGVHRSSINKAIKTNGVCCGMHFVSVTK